MPPRHAYWTIIFGNQPTSFRAATREELLPTFKQIQARHPDAVMMWFARGRLWKSEEEARDALFRRRDEHRPRKPPFGDRPAGTGDAPPAKDRWRNRPPGAPGAPGSGDAGRGRDWRPGGQHKDPRDRFKVPRDVKRARFKAQLVRDRVDPKPGSPPAAPRSHGGEGWKPPGEGARPSRPADQRPWNPRPPRPNDQRPRDPRPPRPDDQRPRDPRPPRPNDQRPRDPRPPRPDDQRPRDPRPPRPNDQRPRDPRPPRPDDQRPRFPRPPRPDDQRPHFPRPPRPNDQRSRFPRPEGRGGQPPPRPRKKKDDK